MACTDIEEVEKNCLNNLGGGTDLVYNDQDEITVTIDPALHKVTAAVHLSAFKRIAFKRNAILVTPAEAIDLDQGSNFEVVNIALSLKRREAEKSIPIKIMSEGQRFLAFFFKDGNGIWWYIPNAQKNQNAGTFGQNKAEGSKYDLNFIAENEITMYEVDASVIATILAEPAP